MFSILQNFSGKSLYYTVSPIANFTYGMAAGMNINGYVEAAKSGSDAFGIIEDDQDCNNSTCVNDEVKIWMGDMILETDQFSKIPQGSTFATYYAVGGFLTVENGIWKPAKLPGDAICGVIMDYPNSTNGFLLVLRTAFPNSVPTLQPTNLDLDYDPDQLELDFSPPKIPKIGNFGGAVCDECGVENQYMDPVPDYICRSCKSYKEM